MSNNNMNIVGAIISSAMVIGTTAVAVGVVQGVKAEANPLGAIFGYGPNFRSADGRYMSKEAAAIHGVAELGSQAAKHIGDVASWIWDNTPSVTALFSETK